MLNIILLGGGGGGGGGGDAFWGWNGVFKKKKKYSCF